MVLIVRGIDLCQQLLRSGCSCKRSVTVRLIRVRSSPAARLVKVIATTLEW
jgi:hypothetical protein